MDSSIHQNLFRVRARIASTLALMATVITAIMGVVAFCNGDLRQMTIEFSSTVAAVVAFFVFRRTRSLEVPSVIILSIVGLNLALSIDAVGSFENSTTGWIPIIALAGYAVAGRAIGYGAAIAGLAFVAVGTYLTFSGVWPSNPNAIGSALSSSFMIIGALGIIIFFERYQQMEVELERSSRQALAELNEELVQALDEVRELEGRLQEAERHGSLQRLAGHFAHDFNNMLTGIMAEVDLAALRVEDPEIRDGLENALASSKKAAELTRSMLTYSGHRTLRRSVVSASTVLEDVRRLAQLSTRHGVEFKNPDDEEVCVRGDVSQLEQALLNLVLNGVQASEDERPRIDLEVSQGELGEEIVGVAGTRLADGPFVRLAVRDYGRGVSPDVAAAIFEPYFTTRDDGQGLGLSSVAGIVRAHGGALTLDQLEVGTRMSIWLSRPDCSEDDDPVTEPAIP